MILSDLNFKTSGLSPPLGGKPVLFQTPGVFCFETNLSDRDERKLGACEVSVR